MYVCGCVCVLICMNKTVRFELIRNFLQTNLKLNMVSATKINLINQSFSRVSSFFPFFSYVMFNVTKLTDFSQKLLFFFVQNSKAFFLLKTQKLFSVHSLLNAFLSFLSQNTLNCTIHNFFVSFTSSP